MSVRSKIDPCLWFDGKAEEAATFYVNLFNSSPHASQLPASSVGLKTHYTKEAGQHCHSFEAGAVLTVNFNLAGHSFLALNGGPSFKFTPAISLMIECADQEEIDHFWNGFSEDVAEREMNCGWVMDRYGLAWQVVPRYIRDLIEDKSAKAKYERFHIWGSTKLPKKLVLSEVKAVCEGSGNPAA